MARMRPGGRGDAQHRARIRRAGPPAAGPGPRAGSEPAGRPRLRRRPAAPRRRTRCPRSGRAAARPSRDPGRRPGSPATCAASSVGREGLELEALHPLAALLLGQRTAAAGGGGAARRCGTCRRAARARRAGPAAARRAARASSGRPNAGPRPRTGGLHRLPAGRAARAASRTARPGLTRRCAPHDRSAPPSSPTPGRAAPARRAPARPASRRPRRLELTREASQRRGDRRVGLLAGAERLALAAQHARPAIGGAALELAQQPRLADARLAADEGGARHAALGPRKGGIEAGELRCAADELRARDPRWHTAASRPVAGTARTLMTTSGPPAAW